MEIAQVSSCPRKTTSAAPHGLAGSVAFSTGWTGLHSAGLPPPAAVHGAAVMRPGPGCLCRS